MTEASPKSVQLYASDLKVGDTFSGVPRQIGDAQFSAFAQLTGDNHPIHYDDEFAAQTRYGQRLAHGLLIASMTAMGATRMSSQIEDAMIAFVGNAFTYLKPVFVNDIVTSHFRIAQIDSKPERNSAFVRFDVTLENQHGENVLQGHHTYLLHLRAD